MQFRDAEIQHIANLARLELSAAELASYGRQLSDITAYIDHLQAVTAVAPEMAASLHNVWREDFVEDWDVEENGRALNQGNLEHGLLKVKRVL